MRGTKLPENVDVKLAAKAQSEGTTVSMAIRKLVEDGLAKPDLTLADVAKLRGSIVYLLRDDSGAPLYAGSSRVGISRPFDRNHHKIADRNEPGDSLELFYCESEAEARKLERRLVVDLKPQLNEVMFDAPTGTKGMQTFTTKFPDDLAELLKARADHDKTTVSMTLRRLAEGGLRAIKPADEPSKAAPRKPVVQPHRVTPPRSFSPPHEPCRFCGHNKTSHGNRGCFGSCACNERKYEVAR